MGKLNFGATGMSYECRKVDMATTGAPRCPRCEDRVYFNEEKKALGKSWHTRCFTCALCKKSLSTHNCANHDDEIYCTNCHRKNFGPKGYGFAGGAAGLSTDATTSLASRATPAGVNGEQPQVQHVAPPQVQPSAAAQKFASLSRGDNCPRCDKKVYFAEEVNVRTRKWHKLCFKCENCNKLLEPSKFTEHEGSTFCQPCYSKKFGPKGYGFAGGCGTLMSSDQPRPLANRTNYPAVKAHTQTIVGSQEWTEPVRPNFTQ